MYIRTLIEVSILTYNDRDVTHLHMMMILSGAWPQATAWQGPGAAAEPAPAPAGPHDQAMACARYKDGSLAAEPLVGFIGTNLELLNLQDYVGMSVFSIVSH